MRPVDLARAHGLSAQAVRNYEAAGILPGAERTVSGYRAYTPVHAAALDAFVALVPGHGHPAATMIMQAVNRGAVADALRLVDEGHVQLLEDRRTLQAVAAAIKDVTTKAAAAKGVTTREAAAKAAASERVVTNGDVFVGPLARRLNVRPATLRKWERAGVVTPGRDPRTGFRVYSAADVRDAMLAHQLRRGGYLLAQIASVVAQVRAAGSVAALEAMLGDWQARLDARSRAMLSGAAGLDTYLKMLEGRGWRSSGT
jgi:DNA-binding transcriptional MerR regulator